MLVNLDRHVWSVVPQKNLKKDHKKRATLFERAANLNIPADLTPYPDGRDNRNGRIVNPSQRLHERSENNE